MSYINNKIKLFPKGEIINTYKIFNIFQDFNQNLLLDIPIFKNGKPIKIKEKNKGSFTKYCNGKVTSECIARGKRSPSKAIRKKAIFAQNARKWNKHLNGGILYNNEDVLNDLLNNLK